MFKGLVFFLKFGWKYDKRYVLWNIFHQLLASLMPVFAALMPKFIIDELMGGRRIELMLIYVGLFAGYALMASSLSSFFYMDGFTRRCRVSAQFDEEQHMRLIRADLIRLESPAYRDMKEKAQRFLTCDRHGFGYLLDCALRIVGQSVTLIGIAAIISTLNVWIVLAFAVLAGGSVWIEGQLRKKAMALSMQVSSDSRRWMYLSGLFEDTPCGKEIRINRIGSWLLHKEREGIGRINDNLKQQNDLFIRSGVMTAVFTFIQQCVSYVCLIFRVLRGAIGIGDFTMYTGSVTAFASALREVMNSLIEIRTYDMYYDQLDEFLSVPETLRQGKRLPLPEGAHQIEIRDVSFRYPGADKWALKHISLTLEPGEKLSIVGENGSGKTTLIKLLARMYDPTEGEILLDGVDIRDIDYDEYMSLFSAVFQDFKLFSFSLRENIALGNDIPDEEILRTLDQVGLHGFAAALPRGLDTHVGRMFDEQGIEPSGGEGQRIALARALLKNAPIVILDEPTAALDPRAEYEIYQGFQSLTEGRSAVYISHRLSSARFCDRIAVLEQGRLTEYGTHGELMELNGKYAELFAMQAQFYTENE